MLEQNMGVRKGKVNLGSIADEGPVGTQKIAKQLVATQDELRREDHMHESNKGSSALGGAHSGQG